MRADETRAVMNALSGAGGSARFVGGAVRNALLGLNVDDIDITTPLLPNEVMRRLEAARIRAVPTGIDHGTVTAIVDGKAFEITTLRRDVETDGRHAVVAFSDDWEEDASRRDFTINALYASPDGEVFDYFAGLVDLDARRIRFIGDPAARIREDYLRILRLFRFHAWYGQGAIDGQALEAAKAGRAGLRQLSGERIQKEMLRLLAAKNPCPALRVMAQTKILEEIIPRGARLDRLERLVAIDTANDFVPESVLRLSALLPADPGSVTIVAERMRFSNENRDRLADLVSAQDEISLAMAGQTLHWLLYRLGLPRVRDRIFLRWAEDTDVSHDPGWGDLLAAAKSWVIPEFPLGGRDVLSAGIQAGPQVGAILSHLENEWIEGDFAGDRPSLLKRLDEIVQSPAALSRPDRS